MCKTCWYNKTEAYFKKEKKSYRALHTAILLDWLLFTPFLFFLHTYYYIKGPPKTIKTVSVTWNMPAVPAMLRISYICIFVWMHGHCIYSYLFNKPPPTYFHVPKKKKIVLFLFHSTVCFYNSANKICLVNNLTKILMHALSDQ